MQDFLERKLPISVREERIDQVVPRFNRFTTASGLQPGGGELGGARHGRFYHHPCPFCHVCRRVRRPQTIQKANQKIVTSRSEAGTEASQLGNGRWPRIWRCFKQGGFHCSHGSLKLCLKVGWARAAEEVEMRENGRFHFWQSTQPNILLFVHLLPIRNGLPQLCLPVINFQGANGKGGLGFGNRGRGRKEGRERPFSGHYQRKWTSPNAGLRHRDNFAISINQVDHFIKQMQQPGCLRFVQPPFCARGKQFGRYVNGCHRAAIVAENVANSAKNGRETKILP